MFVFKKLASYIRFKKYENDNINLRPHPKSITSKYIVQNYKNT